MFSPVISIIMPSYNAPQITAEAVISVRTQDHTKWELIIIDDGSTPDNQVILNALISAFEDTRIRLVLSKKNRGPARARNLGVRLAQGRYVAFLDADDLWLPTKLSVQLSALQQTGVALSCTAYENISVTTNQSSYRTPPEKITYDQLLLKNTIGCSTVMFDRARLGRSYFPDIKMRQDFAHWLKILRQGGYALGLRVPLTQRRQFVGSLSANKVRAAWYTWRMYRDIEGFDLWQAARCFSAYTWTGIFPQNPE